MSWIYKHRRFTHAGIILPDLINIMTEPSIGENALTYSPGRCFESGYTITDGRSLVNEVDLTSFSVCIILNRHHQCGCYNLTSRLSKRKSITEGRITFNSFIRLLVVVVVASICLFHHR